MAKAGVVTQRQFVLIPDTNIVRTPEDSLRLFNKDFLDFWTHIASCYSVTLQLPYIVLEEIREQKAYAALKRAKEGVASLQHLWAITGRGIAVTIDEIDSVRESLTSLLTSQFAELPGDREFILVPYRDISLEELAKAAVKRMPPFEKDKGFKDALILETVKKAITDNSSRDVALVSQDGALRAAGYNLRQRNKNVGVYASFEEFKTFIQVAATKYPAELLHAVTRRAAERFFKPGDESTLWFQFHIEQRLERLLDESAVKTHGAAWILTSVNGIRNAMAVRQRPSAYTVGDTALAGVVGDNTFRWRTTVYCKVEYTWGRGGLLYSDGSMREVKEGVVTILWSSSVVNEELKDDIIDRIEVGGLFT